MTGKDKLTRARTDLHAIIGDYDRAVSRLKDQRRGQPGSGFGGSGNRGSSSPVETALGLSGVGGGTIIPDTASERLKQVDQLTRRIATDVALLRRLVDAARHASTSEIRRRKWVCSTSRRMSVFPPAMSDQKVAARSATVGST